MGYQNETNLYVKCTYSASYFFIIILVRILTEIDKKQLSIFLKIALIIIEINV